MVIVYSYSVHHRSRRDPSGNSLKFTVYIIGAVEILVVIVIVYSVHHRSRRDHGGNSL